MNQFQLYRHIIIMSSFISNSSWIYIWPRDVQAIMLLYRVCILLASTNNWHRHIGFCQDFKLCLYYCVRRYFSWPNVMMIDHEKEIQESSDTVVQNSGVENPDGTICGDASRLCGPAGYGHRGCGNNRVIACTSLGQM